jgi:arylsulfatase A-like enzyme
MCGTKQGGVSVDELCPATCDMCKPTPFDCEHYTGNGMYSECVSFKHNDTGMKICHFDQTSKVCTFAPTAPPVAQHVVMIISDDQGWGNIGYNNPNVITPQADALAASGIKLGRHYTAASCGPSRMSFLTGRSPYVYGFTDWLSKSIVTIAERFEDAGFKTSHVGKWHVTQRLDSVGEASLPQHRGFGTSSLSHIWGACSHKMQLSSLNRMEKCLAHCTNKPTEGTYYNNTLEKRQGCESDLWVHRECTAWGAADAAARTCGGYSGNGQYKRCLAVDGCKWELSSKTCFGKPAATPSTTTRPHCNTSRPAAELIGQFNGDIYADEVTRIVEALTLSNRLFLLIAPTMAHKPYINEYPPHFKDLYPLKLSNEFREMNALVTSMDPLIGHTVDTLKRNNLWDTTLFVYLSDNGGQICNGGYANNGMLRGGKKMILEGGIRTPAFLAGGVIPSNLRGSEKNGYVYIPDWYNTLINAAGIQNQTFDEERIKLHLNDTVKLNNDGTVRYKYDYDPYYTDSNNIWPYLTSAPDSGIVSKRETLLLGSIFAYASNYNFLPIGIISGDFKYIPHAVFFDTYASKIEKNLKNEHKCFGWLGPKVGGTSETEPSKSECSNRDSKGQPTNPKCTWDLSGRCGETGCLFNIHSDPGELHNIALDFPEVVANLQTRLNTSQANAIVYWRRTGFPTSSDLRNWTVSENPKLKGTVVRAYCPKFMHTKEEYCETDIFLTQNMSLPCTLYAPPTSTPMPTPPLAPLPTPAPHMCTTLAKNECTAAKCIWKENNPKCYWPAVTQTSTTSDVADPIPFSSLHTITHVNKMCALHATKKQCEASDRACKWRPEGCLTASQACGSYNYKVGCQNSEIQCFWFDQLDACHLTPPCERHTSDFQCTSADEGCSWGVLDQPSCVPPPATIVANNFVVADSNNGETLRTAIIPIAKGKAADETSNDEMDSVHRYFFQRDIIDGYGDDWSGYDD